MKEELELIFEKGKSSYFSVKCPDCKKQSRFLLLDGVAHRGFYKGRLLTKIKHTNKNECKN